MSKFDDMIKTVHRLNLIAEKINMLSDQGRNDETYELRELHRQLELAIQDLKS